MEMFCRSQRENFRVPIRSEERRVGKGSYYYTLGKAYAMSANYAVSERIKSGEGKVVDVKETPKGYFVTVEFDE